MAMGRPPKPVSQKIAEGNPGKRPLPPDIVVGGRPKELPAPPDFLNKDGHRFWEQTVPALAELGVLDHVDVPALEMAAIAYQRFHQARRVLKRDGIMTRGAKKQIRPHPALAVEREAQATFLRIAAEFGLTATARARLGISILQGQSLQHAMATELGDTEFQPA